MRNAVPFIGKAFICKGLKDKARFFLYAVKIKHKLYTIMTVITLIPVIVLGFTLYGVSKKDIVELGNNSMEHYTVQLGNMIDFYFETIINKSDVIYRNTDIQDKLVKEYDDPAEIVETYYDLQNLLLPLIFEIKYPDMKYSRPSLADSGKILFTIYSQNPTINFYDRGGSSNISVCKFELLKSSDWYKDMIDRGQSSFYWRLPYDTVYDGKTEKYFSLNRRFINIRSSREIGVLSVEVPLQSLQEMMDGHLSNKQWWIYLLSEDGSLITSSSEAVIDKACLEKIRGEMVEGRNEGFLSHKIEKQNIMTFFTTCNISGWKIAVMAPDTNTNGNIFKTTMLTILVCIISFVCSLILMMTLSNVITGRLKRLTVKIRNIRNDTSQVMDIIGGSDEIGELDHQFNKMIYRINELIEKEYKVRLNMKMAEVELLQEQLNPHLLYNSLSAIRWMSRNNDIQNIADITENLIYFYKATLSKGNIYIKVSDEISIISQYISLIHKVYRMNVEYRLNINNDVDELYCIKLILQPVVENALLHGIRGVDRAGMIDISVNADGRLLIFTITDNGKGMDEDIIMEIMNDNVMGKKGFGIRNVMNRIKLFYGDEYGLSISAISGEGTIVRITLPCCSGEDMENLYKKFRAV